MTKQELVKQQPKFSVAIQSDAYKNLINNTSKIYYLNFKGFPNSILSIVKSLRVYQPFQRVTIS